MNYLLGKDFMSFISQPFVVVGVCLLIVGLSIVILAKRITRASRKKNNIDPSDPMLIKLRIVGIVLIVIGFISIIISIVHSLGVF